jgi:hypothetical protein
LTVTLNSAQFSDDDSIAIQKDCTIHGKHINFDMRLCLPRLWSGNRRCDGGGRNQFIVRFIHENQRFTAVRAIWTAETRGGGSGPDAITSEGSSRFRPFMN